MNGFIRIYYEIRWLYIGVIKMSIVTNVYLKEGIIMSADSRIIRITTYVNGTKDRYTYSDNDQDFLIKNNSIRISSW